MIFNKMRIGVVLFSLLIVGCNSPTAELEELTDRDGYLKELRTENTKFDLKVLLGKWEDNNKNNTFQEIWTAQNDSIYNGIGIEILDNDTLKIEKLTVIALNNKLRYGVVANNSDNTIWFEEVGNTKNEIIFENKNHNFPQRIIYSKDYYNQIVARIEGVVNDSLIQYNFDYSKID